MEVTGMTGYCEQLTFYSISCDAFMKINDATQFCRQRFKQMISIYLFIIIAGRCISILQQSTNVYTYVCMYMQVELCFIFIHLSNNL